MKTSCSIALALAAVHAAASPSAANEPVPFGFLTAKITWGKREATYEYTRRESEQASQLRIDNKRIALPTSPYNLIDLRSGEATILYPHNSTYVRIPAERMAAKDQAPAANPELPPLPPGIGPQTVPGAPSATTPSDRTPAPPATPDPKLPESVTLPPGVRPQATPGASGASGAPGTPPATPAPPAGIPLPDGVELPPGIGPGATPSPGGGAPSTPGPPPGVTAPAPPPMPAFPGTGPAAPKLTKTDQIREIHQLTCTLYTLTRPDEGTLELWCTENLGSFYLHLAAPPTHRGQQEFLESWPPILREARLFPLLAVLKQEGPERYRFEVTHINREPIPAKAVPYQVPESFHQVELLAF